MQCRVEGEFWHPTSNQSDNRSRFKLKDKRYNKATKDGKYLSQLTMTAHQRSILHSVQVSPIKAGSAIG